MHSLWSVDSWKLGDVWLRHCRKQNIPALHIFQPARVDAHDAFPHIGIDSFHGPIAYVYRMHMSKYVAPQALDLGAGECLLWIADLLNRDRSPDFSRRQRLLQFDRFLVLLGLG